MAELVDAQDLKSCVGQPTCQFDSGSRHKGLPKGRPFLLGVAHDIPLIFFTMSVQID